MNFKKIKPYFVTSFIGFLIGVFISPIAYKPFKQAFLSPVKATFAESEDYINPLVEGEVLGVYDNIAQTEDLVDTNENTQLAFAMPKAKINPEITDESHDEINSVEITSKALGEETSSNNSNPAEVKQTNYSSITGNMTIAVVGDSMVDVMGQDLPYLQTALKQYSSNIQFNLLNYGVGAENIEKGLARIKGEYDYKGRHYSSLAALNPDIVVIESFAYNPFPDSGGELDRHWNALSQMVDYVKGNTKAKIIILATIAPAKANFGQGPGGVNWPADLAWQHAERINGLLENTVNFANSAGLPLVDAYHKTLLSSGEGNPSYISTHDHIHQNGQGNVFVLSLLAQKIFSLNFFN